MNWKAIFVVAALLGAGCQWTYTSSAELDPAKVRPFLALLEADLDLGLDVESLSTFVEIVPANETVMRRIDVHTDGTIRTIRFVVEMDGAELPTLAFKTHSRELSEKINTYIKTSPHVGHNAT